MTKSLEDLLDLPTMYEEEEETLTPPQAAEAAHRAHRRVAPSASWLSDEAGRSEVTLAHRGGSPGARLLPFARRADRPRWVTVSL